MKLDFLTLMIALIVSSTSAFADDNCGTFKFTNNLQANLYIESSSSVADFCHENLPHVILPGQTVSIPIAENHQPYVNITTDSSRSKIAADYFLELYFDNGRYDFNDELNTQAFSWRSEKENLAFCTDKNFKKSGGDCFLYRVS